MSRSSLLSLTAILVLLALAVPLLAQDTADISIGGGLVARLRDPGGFASVRERAAKVDQKLCEVVSTKDTQHPRVSVKQKNKVWTVYAWEIAIMGVTPAEAKANQVSEKQLAERWAKTLAQQLPKATPCSKLPPEMLGYKRGGKPAAGKAPAGKAVTTATASTVTVKPTAAEPPVRIPAARPASALKGNETGAMLLIVDALRTARAMNDQDWATQKEPLARNLYNDLSYYLTGRGAPPQLPVVKPVKVKTTGKPVKPAKPVKALPTKPAKPSATAAKPVKPVATVKPAATAATASTAKVPQKTRIRAKFEAAKDPFNKLQASDPQAAAQVSATLAASRQAFAYGNFDEAEKQVDAALSALGVQFQE
jgi:hypothetical protein